MSSIGEEIHAIHSELPGGVRLVAVSKYQPLDSLQAAYDAGQRIFGESHVQELQAKHAALPSDIEWHFIGHLQTNKVKYIAPYVSLIHAVDSWRLLQEIDKQGVKAGREEIRCLLQLHIAQEETKFGFTPDECRTLLTTGEWRNLRSARIAGIMCIASNVEDEAQIRHEFQTAHTFFQEMKAEHFAHDPAFCECSWGMSGDYPLAIAEGSTLVRVGSKIFGERI